MSSCQDGLFPTCDICARRPCQCDIGDKTSSGDMSQGMLIWISQRVQELSDALDAEEAKWLMDMAQMYVLGYRRKIPKSWVYLVEQYREFERLEALKKDPEYETYLRLKEKFK